MIKKLFLLKLFFILKWELLITLVLKSLPEKQSKTNFLRFSILENIVEAINHTTILNRAKLRT